MFLEIITLLLAGTLALMAYYRHRNGDWSKLGIKGTRFSLLGNNPTFGIEFILKIKNGITLGKELAQKFRGEKLYGTYGLGGEKIIMIQDPELVKAITVKDFEHFVDRNGNVSDAMTCSGTPTDNLWSKQLSMAKGDDWKNIRSAFSPIFTSGKMKMMMTFINEVNKKLEKSIEDDLQGRPSMEIELKDRFGRVSMDNIASCAFGVDAKSFENSQSQFIKNAFSLFRFSWSSPIRFLLISIPYGNYIMKKLNLPFFEKEPTMFFFDTIVATLNYRKKQRKEDRRNDLIDMMLDIMDSSDYVEEDIKVSYKTERKSLDETHVVATAMVFFVAGYDTTGTIMSFLMYELAKNQEAQKRLQTEIDDLNLPENSVSPDYTTVQGMEYLNMVILETLRKYPQLETINRGCTKPYRIPGTEIRLNIGDEIHISSSGLHYNPDFYPHPQRWDPDRFSKENQASRHPYTFVGFGTGPRGCIGQRFALLEIKMATLSFFRRYSVKQCDKTPKTVTLNPSSMLGSAVEDLTVEVERR